MRTLTLAFISCFLMMECLAQVPAECAEVPDIDQEQRSPNDTLKACSQALKATHDTLPKAMATVYPGVDVTDSADGARAAASIVAKDFSDLATTACSSSSTDATCVFISELQSRAERLVQGRSSEDVGRIYYEIDTLSASHLVMGVRRRAQEPIYFCGYVQNADWRDTTACADAAAACDRDCQDRINRVVHILPRLKVLQPAAVLLSQHIVDEERKVARARVAAWDSYILGGDGADPQHLGEVYLNDWLFLRDDQEAMVSSTLPPEQSLVLLRPGLGLETFEADGTKVELAGLVELIGYRSWDWTDEGKRKDAWGVSLIAAYSPEDDADDWGYGVLVKTPFENIDVSWTVRDSRDGTRHAFMFSTDLSRLLPSMAKDRACNLLGESDGCFDAQ